MVLNRLLHALAAWYGANNFRSHPRMSLDLVELILGERAGLVQNSLGNKNLSNVMHSGGVDQVCPLLRSHPPGAPAHLCVSRHSVPTTCSLMLATRRGPRHTV